MFLVLSNLISARRSCRPCFTLKIRCNRGLPSCQSCVNRGKPEMCVYEESQQLLGPPGKGRGFRSSVVSTKSEKLLECEPETHHSHSHSEGMQPAIQRTTTESPAVDTTFSLPERVEAKPIPKECHLDSTTHEVDNSHFPAMTHTILSDAEWTKPYFEMYLPTTLPSRVMLPQSPSDPGVTDTGPHTIYQLLLVLNYLFISVMLPGDDRALWCLIQRCEKDWEESFVLQYDRLLWWLVSARRTLTEASDLHSMSVEDLKSQIGYILFVLGQHASPTRGLFKTYQQPEPPYRPFGVRASIALMCHALAGIQITDMKGYETKEIWTYDQETFSTMACRLQQSPIFTADFAVHQLQSIILSLQKAFQLEEIRVASTKPQAICIGDSAARMEYYRRAFISLDPMLLPKILTIALTMKPKLEIMIDVLATLLARQFHESRSMEELEIGFKMVPEIWQSKPDRVIVTEMFHVKAFEQSWRCGYFGELRAAPSMRDADEVNYTAGASHVFVFHVSLKQQTLSMGE